MESMNIMIDKIRDLLCQMTLEEKVGQLNQCGPSLAGAFEVDFEELLNMRFDGRISKDEFDRMMDTVENDYHEADIRAGKIGSLNGVQNAETVIRLQKIAVEETRLGIPLFFGYDVIHGYRTIFPIPLAESCAWDEKLWEETARISAKEATAGGVNMTFAPMIDVAKDARWGRICEGAGEDVYLTSKFGVAKVKGYQGDDLKNKDSMVACIKHFAAYGAAEAGRDYNRVDMSMQRFYEEYLPPFEKALKAGARAVMPAFNDINGVPCSVNKWLLKKLLREEWEFDGVTVSDSNAIAECVEHGIAVDKADASAQALDAGMDIDMSSNSYIESLVELVREGKISEKTLDHMVADVLRIKFEMGLFDDPYQTSIERETEEILRQEYRDSARKAAEKSIVLLKNDDVLPLNRGIKIGIVGELADARGEMVGAWAIGANDDDCVSIIDACKQQNINYAYTKGIEDGMIDRTAIKKMAEDCDILLAVVGERKLESGEASSRADISLPERQEEMLAVMLETGKSVVAVLFNGRPLAIPWTAEHIPAIIEAWHLGVEAGNAILNVLFGDVNPSGKLTVTFPYAAGQCPIYYGHINTGRPGGKSKFTSKYLDTPLEPVYPFGFGLSYTTFEYGDLEISQLDNVLHISVKVKNAGSIAGEEIVQCYTRQVTGKRVRPVKQLRAFEKIILEAGEFKQVEFEIPVDCLGYYDQQMKYVVDGGAYELFVGTSSVSGLSKRIDVRVLN